MAQTDPITIATIWHFIQKVCVEMRETMERTGSNPLATSLHGLVAAIAMWFAFQPPASYRRWIEGRARANAAPGQPD